LRKASIIMAVVMALTLMTASVALAGEPTCAGLETGHGPLVNHGDHVTGDYVEVNGSAGGGSPAHFGDHPGATPGATFCGPGNNQAPELLGEPGRFAD